MKPVDPHTIQAIRQARESEGLTLGQLVKRFRLSKSTVFNYIQGCDDAKVKASCPSRRVVKPVEPRVRPDLSKGDLGEAARQMICARLLLAGLQVFRPLGEDTPIDLLLLREDGTALRCQCKYVYPNTFGSHTFKFCAMRSRGGGSKRQRHAYTEKEVDFFLGYCQDDDSVYVVPRQNTGGRKEVLLWILRSPEGFNLKGVFDHLPWKNAFHLLR